MLRMIKESVFAFIDDEALTRGAAIAFYTVTSDRSSSVYRRRDRRTCSSARTPPEVQSLGNLRA